MLSLSLYEISYPYQIAMDRVPKIQFMVESLGYIGIELLDVLE